MKLAHGNDLGRIEVEGDADFCMWAVRNFIDLCKGIKARWAHDERVLQADLRRMALMKEHLQLLGKRAELDSRLREITRNLRSA